MAKKSDKIGIGSVIEDLTLRRRDGSRLLLLLGAG